MNNYVTYPPKYSRKGITTVAQYSIWDFDQHLEQYPLAKYLHLKAPEYYAEQPCKCWNEDIRADEPLGAIDQSDFERFKEQIRKIKELGCYFGFWGISGQGGGKRPEGPGYTRCECCAMPKEWHDWMVAEVGDLFAGWDIGEWDGLYGRDVIYYLSKEERPKSRREGHSMFMDYLRGWSDRMNNYACTICGVTFPHYFNEIGITFLGAEIGQGLLNTQVYISFLRGALAQYGIGFKTISSSYDRWGMTKSSVSDTPTLQRSDGTWVKFRMGPYDGHSDGMSKANWIISFLSGAKAAGQDYGIYGEPRPDGVNSLTALGEALLSVSKWTESPWAFGEQHRPLALMLDYYCGWTPPRHLYSFEERVVWHCIPYGTCDEGMDQAFDLFYPGYTWAGYFRDERGFITPTPNGDCADVLLNDASPEVIKKYPVIWLISDEDYSGDEAFLERLRQYVEAGGHLICGGKPLETILDKWFNQKLGKSTECVCSFDESGKTMLREAYYTVRELENASGWDVHYRSESGLPVIIGKNLGQGRISGLMSTHGLTDNITSPGFDMWDCLQYKHNHSYELLNCVKQHIKELVAAASPLHIEGKDIYYSINTVKDEDYVLCLYNPGQEDWHGRIAASGDGKLVLTPADGPLDWKGTVNGNKVNLSANEMLILNAKVKM